MQYHVMDLEAFDYSKANNGAESFRVRVAKSPAGEQKLADAKTVTLAADLRSRLRRLENRALDFSQMISLGRELADMLFPGEMKAYVDQSLNKIGSDAGLRVQLKLDSYVLADMPWEYIYLPQPGTPPDDENIWHFLVLNKRILMVRYEVQAKPLSPLNPVGQDCPRLVTLMADPNRPPQYPPLKLADERKKIEEALKKLTLLRSDFYDDATVETLEDALVGGTQVFHFSGHGKFEGDLGISYKSLAGKGFIVMLNEEREPIMFSVENLVMNLKGSGVRLAVLGACETGRRDGECAWTGIAPALAHADIPAVVSMQYTIRDRNAIAFSRAFYRNLAEHQSIDAALTAGRIAIASRRASDKDDERDWGVPVLYLRADEHEGVIFPKMSALGQENKHQPDPRSGPAVGLIDHRPGAGDIRSGSDSTCFNCHQPINANHKFCQNCGARQMKDCAKCNTSNSAGAVFCSNCGERFA